MYRPTFFHPFSKPPCSEVFDLLKIILPRLKGQPYSHYTINSIAWKFIHVSCILVCFQEFFNSCFQMISLSSGIKASTWTYSVAIKACRAPPGVRLSQLDFAKGLELLDEMRKNKLEPDSMTYTAVFVLCAQAKQGSTANTIYQVVLRRFLSWTLITSCQNDVFAPTSTVTQSSVWFESQEISKHNVACH